jgi:hypothetical protein
MNMIFVGSEFDSVGQAAQALLSDLTSNINIWPDS